MADAPPATSPRPGPGAWLGRAALLLLTLAGVGIALGGMLANHRTAPRDWAGFAVAVLLAAAAGWIVVRPGRSTRIVACSFLGLLLAGAPFLDAPIAVIRLDGLVLVNLAILWAIVPKLGLVLRRHLRWILLGVGLYLVTLSFALHARDEWRRYHGYAPAPEAGAEP